MSDYKYIRGAVLLVRCPRCQKFFLVHWYAKRTACKFCRLYFNLKLGPKSRNYKPPKDRIIAQFERADEAKELLDKLNAFVDQGLTITNEEVNKIIGAKI
jgi:hypothetical protein